MPMSYVLGGMDNSPKKHLYQLTLAKCWQGQEPWLCFQATLSHAEDRAEPWQRARGYLIVDGRQGHAPLSWSSEKPDGLIQGGGSISQVIRKYLSTARCFSLDKSITANGFSRTLVGLVQGDLTFCLSVLDSTPREIELLSYQKENSSESHVTSLFRWSQKGVFTVKKILNDPFTQESLNDFYAGIKNLSSGEASYVSPGTNLSSVILSWIHPSNSAVSNEDTLSSSNLPVYQRVAKNRITRRLKTLEKTWRQDAKKIPKDEELRALKENATLLRTWIHLVTPGAYELVLDGPTSGLSKTITIPLDSDLSAGENLNKLHHEINRKQRGINLGTKRDEQLKGQIQRLQTILTQLQSSEALSEETVSNLLRDGGLASKDFKSQTQQKKSNPKHCPPGRFFKSSDGAIMQLGRTAEENDRVTKAAKSNDWWVHASGGVQGAHVIIHRKSLGASPISESTLREAAILAIHFSKQSLSKSGEVYQTTRGCLRKRKGMPAGLWLVERSKTVVVRYDDSELKAIFSREVRQGTLREHHESV
jgi:predicted ribosome quality control (RQC) complex YloA/Tae2 family protein